MRTYSGRCPWGSIGAACRWRSRCCCAARVTMVSQFATTRHRLSHSHSHDSQRRIGSPSWLPLGTQVLDNRNLRRHFRMAIACVCYGFVSPAEDEDAPPPSVLLGEVSSPPSVAPPASAGLSWPVEVVIGTIVSVAEELSPLGCVAVSPGSNLLPEVMMSCDVCEVSIGSTDALGVGDAEGVLLSGSLLGATVNVDTI